MRPSTLVIYIALIFFVAMPRIADAHSLFKKPFQQQYQFRSVTCFACHAKGKDENGKSLGKEVLNDLGKDMQKLMVKSRFNERIRDVKKVADSAAKKKVHDEISKEFVNWLKKLENQKSPDGAPWGVLLKAGKIDGVKKQTPKTPEK